MTEANTTTAALAHPGYYITQVFVPWSPNPGVPLLVRCEADATVADVIVGALEKLRGFGPGVFVPSSPSSVELLGAQGDGSVDLSAPSLGSSVVLRSSGLSFPYMLTVRTSEPIPTSGRPASQGSSQGGGMGDTEGARRNSAQGGLNAVPSAKYLSAKEEYFEKLRSLEDVKKKRSEQVEKIERERQEKERKHLQWCEERELARREQVKQKKLEQEKREYESRREEELRRLEQQRAEEAKQREQDILLQKHREEMKQLQEERQRREQEIEQGRKMKAQQKAIAAVNTSSAAETSTAAAPTKASRDKVLDSILGNMHQNMESESQNYEKFLAEQRRQRAFAEQAILEAQYIAKLENEKKAQKSVARQQKIVQKSQKEEIKAREEEQARERELQKQKEEAARKEAWKKQRLEKIQLESLQLEQAHLMLNQWTPQMSSGR
eukprot:PhF_6_TR16966/c1_g1_i1/m.25620